MVDISYILYNLKSVLHDTFLDKKLNNNYREIFVKIKTDIITQYYLELIF